MNSVPASSTPSVAPGSVGAWLLALRPRSLAIAVSPVLVAAALVHARGVAIEPLHALLVLAAAVMIQVITNLQNDVGYTERGAERQRNRIGLPRATALGLLTTGQVRIAISIAILLALALGLPLVLARGAPVLLMGLASILAALAYMGGPRPIAYTPFGEATVFVYFGLVAVVGTEYVLTGETAGAVTWLVAVAIGALAAAALVVNNMRDVDHDRSVGRATLPAVIGHRATGALFGAMTIGPFVLLLPIALLAPPRVAVAALLPLLVLPRAVRLWRDFQRCAPGIAYNAVLFRTFLLELKFAALLAGGCIIAAAAG